MNNSEADLNHWKRAASDPDLQAVVRMAITIMDDVSTWLLKGADVDMIHAQQEVNATVRAAVSVHGYDLSNWDTPSLTALRLVVGQLPAMFDNVNKLLAIRGKLLLKELIYRKVLTQMTERQKPS